MIERTKIYYRGERITSLLSAGYGLVGSVLAGIWYWWFPSIESQSFLISFTLISIAFVGVGLFRFWLSLRKYDDVVVDDQLDAKRMHQIELPRIQAKKQRLKTVRRLEISVIFFSLIGVVILATNGTDQWFLGSLLALCIQSFMLLCFDLFNQFRVEEYLYQLNKWKGKN